VPPPPPPPESAPAVGELLISEDIRLPSCQCFGTYMICRYIYS
jgi:hypothetical protein